VNFILESVSNYSKYSRFNHVRLLYFCEGWRDPSKHDAQPCGPWPDSLPRWWFLSFWLLVLFCLNFTDSKCVLVPWFCPLSCVQMRGISSSVKWHAAKFLYSKLGDQFCGLATWHWTCVLSSQSLAIRISFVSLWFCWLFSVGLICFS